jgi:D-alanyl-D-alanine carboxypeptidase/D-alanyl-D-alanine-endopeptidase (penicillin-binding protein 4)
MLPLAAVAQGVPGGQGIASVAGLPPALASAWKASRLPDSALSLVVREADGGQLVGINAATPRNPASVMKMVTTWTALSELGPNYVWRTEFLLRPGSRPDARGALPGPLYLRAGGDPQLMIQDLWSLLRELRLRGIKQIGDLVIDRSRFGDVATDPGAFDDAPDRPYNASPDAFMVGFGAERLLFLPDPAARKWLPVLDPPLPGVRIEGDVKWSDIRCPGSPVVKTDPVITQSGISIRVSGEAAGSCGEFSVYRLAQSQGDFSTDIFRLLWKDLGGTLTGRVSNGLVPTDAISVVAHDSPPLTEVIRTINKFSNNVMARTLLLTIGAERGRRPATAQSSADVAAQLLAAQGVPVAGLNIDNGAGLAREARLRADSLAVLLDEAWKSPLMPEFVSSLAISGVDGTVRRRMKGEGTRGMAHLKTGTLRDARALAGYVLGASGKRYVVVSLVNDDRADAARAFNDAIVTWLAQR